MQKFMLVFGKPEEKESTLAALKSSAVFYEKN